MTDGNADGNGRVTLALLGQKIDNVLEAVHEIKRCSEQHSTRIVALEVGQGERKTQIDNIKQDVSALEKKSESWSVMNTVGVLIASILGLFGLSK